MTRTIGFITAVLAMALHSISLYPQNLPTEDDIISGFEGDDEISPSLEGRVDLPMDLDQTENLWKYRGKLSLYSSFITSREPPGWFCVSSP